jgi:hydroxymethylpyrimidine pyrophosphatase-like HAD family hydrolase/energy-coupling factor transporter ATP-binding protein EcfA2
MRYLALATDYDGTLASHGEVVATTLDALRRLRESGRKLVLVTGRELPELQRVFPQYAIFDRIVAENGALVFSPETREERLLGEPPPAALVQRLRDSGIQPLSFGRVIIATWSPHEDTVLHAIHELGLELQVIFNKGAVMVLPTGINKARGLRVALEDLLLSPHNAVGVGDAENDHALLGECEIGVAVQNALPMLKQRADLVTAADRGAGVCELIERLLRSDLRELAPRLSRHDLPIGARADDSVVAISPYGRRVLVCGTSGSGKSTLVTSLLEQLNEKRYQFCLIDPEGDFPPMHEALVLGNEDQPPSTDEVIAALRDGEKSVIVNLLGVALERRPEFFMNFSTRCVQLRAQAGRPHWTVIDEAHHLRPASDMELAAPVAHPPSGLLLITVHPDRLAPEILRKIDTLIVRGAAAREMIAHFADSTGRGVPDLPLQRPLASDEALCWTCDTGVVERFHPSEPSTQRRRHRRKYAAGALGEDKSFYFRGARDQLNLRAHNLMLFLQIGDGVDDETWLHHLHQHDYSRWIRGAIKNHALASEIERIELEEGGTAGESRKHIRQAIEKVYTLPA